MNDIDLLAKNLRDATDQLNLAIREAAQHGVMVKITELDMQTVADPYPIKHLSIELYYHIQNSGPFR